METPSFGSPLRQVSKAQSILSINDTWFFYDMSEESVRCILTNSSHDACYLVTGSVNATNNNNSTIYVLCVKYSSSHFRQFEIERTPNNRYLLDKSISTTEYSNVTTAIKFILDKEFPGIPPIFDAEDIIDENTYKLVELPTYDHVQTFPVVLKDLPTLHNRRFSEPTSAEDIDLSLDNATYRPARGNYRRRRCNICIRSISMRNEDANRYNMLQYGWLRFIAILVFYISTLCVIMPIVLYILTLLILVILFMPCILTVLMSYTIYSKCC